jgi:ATP-dependent exoDNAse (exonuclease V) alpha subunit
MPLITVLRERGESEQKIAEELNRHGYRTAKGNVFHQSTVHKLLARKP